MQWATEKGRLGYLYLEVLAVLVILAIVTAAFLPHVRDNPAQRKTHAEYKLQINEAVERYYLNEDRWPADDLSDIGRDRRYFPAGVPTNPLDGTPYTLDPTTHRVY